MDSIFVDSKGWARDDEGNRWYVGAEHAGYHNAFRNSLPRAKGSGYRPASARSYTPKTPLPTPLKAEQLVVLETLANQRPNDNFLRSVVSQLTYRPSLSAAQHKVIRKILEQAGLHDKVDLFP